MSEIATHCRTSKSVFYRYFDDKDGLKRQLGEYVVARMGQRMTEAVAEAGSFQETVRALVTQYLWQIENSPEVYLFVVSETAPADESPVDRFCQAVAQLLVNAHQQHAPTDLQIPETTAGYWAAGVVGLVRGAGEAWMAPRNGTTANRPSLDEFVDTVTAWVVSGSRPPQSP